MTPPAQTPARPTPPFWLALAVCVPICLAMEWLRLVAFPHRIIPLAYALPLLLAMWHRDRRILFGMALLFTFTATYKIILLLPHTEDYLAYDWVTFGMQVGNIWAAALVIHYLLNTRKTLERSNDVLTQTNAELETSNEELAATNEELASREEEITRQNEELQTQAEEMEQQSSELHELNDELSRRERGLSTLLESSRWLRTDMDEPLVMNAICQAAQQVLGEGADASVIAESESGQLVVRGQCGFGASAVAQANLDASLAPIVMERAQTAFIEDLYTRTDIRPPTYQGKSFRSVLATPIVSDGQVIGAIEVYSAQPRSWTQEQFQIMEWLSAQCALSIKAIRGQRELDQKRRDAERASMQKTQFLAAVSHDVRTPANAISLLADLIAQTAEDARTVGEIPGLVGDLKENARALVDLVSDVLDLARFDAGKIDLQISEFPLAALVQAEIRQATPAAQAKGLQLIATLPEPMPNLRTDRMKLARVLSNLVGNALKFTESGSVEVRCRRADDDGLDISVVDTGVGISGEHLPRIFDEFFQLRNPERDRSKGTGLGLAICRRLVDGIGCSMTVESEVGKGSAFTLHLPPEAVLTATDGEMTTISPADRRPNMAPLLGLRILLVDDHDVTRSTVAQLLRSRGASVNTAALGREALQQLSHHPHDVLLLDLMLPDIDGSDVLRQIRGAWPAALKCVLALSGDVRAERINEVRELGAADLIPKPITIDGLMEAIAKHSPKLNVSQPA